MLNALRFKKIVIIFLVLNSSLFADNIVILPYNNSAAALNFIKNYLPENPTILEAGAFDGTNTIEMATLWPQSTIHAFEPVPSIYKRLLSTTKEYKQITTHNYALSDKNGTADFYLSEMVSNPGTHSGSGSLLPPKDHLTIDLAVAFKEKTIVSTRILNDVMEDYGIKKIDFMWLDMQGYELPMLMKSLETLKKTSIVYIEANFLEGYEGQLIYKDYVDWFAKNGFTLIARDTKEEFSVFPEWYCNAVFLNNLNK
jgi:FkbM family methyltransferase